MSNDDLPEEPDRIPGIAHPREARRLIGQSRAQEGFLEAVTTDRMHHAWLLRGPLGVGKATLAYLIARAMIALPGQQDGLFGSAPPLEFSGLEGADTCPVRTRILAGSEPRLHVVKRSHHPNTGRLRGEISVDDARTARRFLTLSAADGGWRVIIVDTVDTMNHNAANALLKFLEEPPARTLFLLVCNIPQRLLPTIRSRCRTLDFQPLSHDAIGKVLVELGVSPEPGTEAALAELGGGSVGAVLRLVEQDGLALYARILQLLVNDQIDRSALSDLADLCSGRTASERFKTVLSLTRLMLARLARAAARGETPTPAAATEPNVIARSAAVPAQAALWAETLSDINASTRRAVAVNLDPGQTILDTFLQIDSVLARARTMGV